MEKTRAQFAGAYIERLISVLHELPLQKLADAIAVLENAYTQERRVIIVGNGGSAATAAHMASDLMLTVPKGVDAVGFRAFSLSDNIAAFSAAANDYGYENAFVAQLKSLASAEDVLVAISGSGNSPNVVRALHWARAQKVHTIGFLGMSGGEAAPLCDVPVVVKSDDYGPIEDVHMILDHLVTAYLSQWLAKRTDSGGE